MQQAQTLHSNCSGIYKTKLALGFFFFFSTKAFRVKWVDHHIQNEWTIWNAEASSMKKEVKSSSAYKVWAAKTSEGRVQAESTVALEGAPAFNAATWAGAWYPALK